MTAAVPLPSPRIDGLQYARWSPKVFGQMRQGRLDAVHATVVYHGGFREAVLGIEEWNRRFERFADLVVRGLTAGDVAAAQESGRTAIFLGFQNPSPIEDDLGLVEIVHQLGVRFMQLTYNNQSLLAGGCHEGEDTGLTRFGREAVREMNRVGLVVDMSHSGERSTLEAIGLSSRPVAITHANPHEWSPSPRNKSANVLDALAESGGMLGFSLYPHHLRGGSDCALGDFCAMVAREAEVRGVDHLGIGSDLCQDRPDSEVAWMRHGRWAKGSLPEEKAPEKFPPPLPWFRDNRDFGNLGDGLRKAGFGEQETAMILGGNWLRFLGESLGPPGGDGQATHGGD